MKLSKVKAFFITPTSHFHFDGKYSMLAVHYIWEDIFWRRKNEKIDWLEKEIR
ncbi:MAG: hypothetical protein IMZ51_01580 [Chloroflexi bacterium]|nr:hypothetical protein [Chloroflexota bacterium]MBE3114531.1 hypothetical protein [Actinomycetota bacterium]